MGHCIRVLGFSGSGRVEREGGLRAGNLVSLRRTVRSCDGVSLRDWSGPLWFGGPAVGRLPDTGNSRTHCRSSFSLGLCEGTVFTLP